MKVKNIMFFGFAAAILSASAANADNYDMIGNGAANNEAYADGRAVVASKSYVDLRGDKLKLDIDAVADTVSTNASTTVTYDGANATGSATHPVYVNSNGEVTATTYELNATVPADAVFTDTTYNVFTGADGTDAGTSGLVKQPAATDNTKFLKGDGTWAVPENTTYNTLTAQEVTTGTDTTGKLVTAKILRDELDNKQGKIGSGHTDKVATFDANGQTQDSGFTIATSVPANAVFTDTTYSDMTGATSSAAGTNGLVPAPGAGDQDKVLKGDGTWYAIPASGNGQLSVTPARTGTATTFTANQATGDDEAVTIYDVPARPTNCTDANPCVLMEGATGYAWYGMATDVVTSPTIQGSEITNPQAQ